MSVGTGKIIDLIFALRRMTHQQLMATSGTVSYVQFVTLRFIEEKKPLMKDVADFLAVTPPSVTALVETLVQSVLVKRTSDEQDRRQIRVTITPKGKNFLKKVTKSMVQNMRQNLECLTRKEQNDLSRILEKLVENKQAKK